MWNINSKKMKWHFVNLVLWANLLLIGGVKATYTSGVKTSVYTSDPQITTQTYTTRHQSHQYVPITGEYHYGHNPNNLGNNGNDNDYQMTITHQSRGSSPQWTSSSSSSSMHGSIDNSYQQPQQHESSYRYHHQQQRQPQPQPQPIYERHPTGHATQQTSGRIQQIENDITDYYTGCPSGHTGQLPYAYDCRRFLNCWKGRGHIQSCSVGTVFNPETLECDRPDKVKCAAGLVGSHVAGKTTQGHLTQTATTSTNRAGRYIDDTTESVDMLCPSGSQGLEPHPADCTKFINCANGNVHVQQCGPGTAFSIPMKVCDFKEKVDCSGRSEATAEVHVHSTQAKADRSQVKCPSGASGLYPHPYDCTKFLQCSNGITYIQDCGPGTGFDSNLKVCDYKEKIHCVAGSSWGTSSHSFNSYGEHGATEFEAVNENVQCPPGASGLHPHPQDCEKFLQCSNGQTFIQNCGPGTGFDSLRLVCDYKEKVQCGSGSVWAITTDVTTVQHGHTQHTTPPNSGGGPNDLPHTSDILCLNGITGLFPYPFDYTKFINCKNGNTAIQNCVQGTAFSISKGYCESLEQIQKIDHVLYIVSEVSYEYAQTLITCPPGTEGIHLYPFNAEKYIKCVHSQMEVIGCNPSQVFSTTRRMCLPRNQVLKTERVRLLSELQKTNNYRNIEEHFDVHTMIYCPMGLSGAYPHPFDSSKYITCSGGRMISESCASGKAFSLSRKHCEMKEDLEARDRVPPIETSYGQEWHISDMETTYGSIDGLTYLMCPPGLSGYFLHPFDCTKYIECSNGATNIDGCANGAVFSISRKQCILRDRVEAYDRVEYLTTTKHEFSNEHVLQADRDLGISCGPGTFGIYPHPQDGHKFMRCANGRIAVENCPPGQVFSIERSSCYNENDVSQYDRSSYVHGQTQGQGHYNRGGARGTTATTTTTTTSTTNNNNHNTLPYYTPSNAEVNCPSPNSNGRYPHPYDCTKFVMCSNGVAHIQSCGPGTAWNKAMEVCDYMDKVECSQSQATTSTTATTSTNPVKQHQPEIQCPPGAEGLFMHPYDWHKYLSCTNGYTHIMDCSPGTVFSVTRKVCDLERNVANTDRCNNGVYSTNYDYSYTQGYNNPGTQSYGSGSNNQWSHTTVTQHQPPTHTYTQQTHTTTQQAGGDRWTNMNIPRPQGSSSSSYDQHSTGWQAVPAGRPVTTNVWSGTAINVDRQEPTHTVIYEEGSLQPDRNYNQHTYTKTPLAPLPASGSTTSTVVYAQPIGSQEASEEVFGNGQPHAQFPIVQNTHHPHPLTPNLNRENFTRTIHFVTPGNSWTPIVSNAYPQVPIVTHLMPPLEVAAQPVDQLMPPFRKEPQSHSRYPLPANKSPTQPSIPLSPGVNVPITHLMPPNYSPPDEGQRPLTDTDRVITTINIDNYTGQVWPGYDSSQLEPLPSGSRKVVTVHETNLYGGLQPPNFNPPQSSTPRTPAPNSDPKPQIPSPTKSTTPIPLIQGYPKLFNATIQTFPHQPHYSPPYAEVAHSHNATWTTGRKVPQQSAIKPTNRLEVSKKLNSEHDEEFSDLKPEQLPLKEALQLMLKPYLVDEKLAAKAESHIMNLVAPIDRHPEETTTIPTSSTHNPLHALSVSSSTPSSPLTTTPQDDVELILAGEQHSLVTTTSVQPGAHKSGTVYDFQHTTVESQHSIHFPHDHDQSATTTTTNWHKHHQHTPSSSKHHHQHSRDFHEKHPNLPNPFDAPLESSGIDVRINDNSCPFSCGNGKCVAQHEVCNGVNNCGNRKDEEQCDHLGYEVRLTGGESSNKGRVEVKILGKWGYVCDDKFGLKDADVVCRELGFKMGAMEVRGSSYYPPADTNAVFNMDEVECKGNETSLRECDFKGWGVNNCGPDEVVGVVCKVQQLKCPDNYWLCTKSEECIPTAFLCDVTPDCSDGSDESPQICNAPIEYRLEGGRSKNEGRLEIFYRGEWGTVCDDDFSQKEAQVVCNSLGYYDKAQVAKNIYGPGSGPIWLDQVSCLGNETTLDKCNHWTWGENNCQHTEDVGIKCTAGPKPTILRPVVTTTPATRISNKDSEYELSELDDLGKYQGLWQRSSKAVHQPKQCGHFKKNLVDEYAHPEERVINGSIAKRGRHPWQATIRTRGRGGISSHWCGAVIISKKLILTAAHCLAGYPKGSYFVRVGDHYANIAEASEVDSNIENWYIHERFREEKHMNNDIALILLKNSLRFNDYVQPICLPEKGSQLQANRMCTISGWGSIKSGTSTPSNILRAAEVPILAEDVCHRKNVYGNAMSEGMFCAGYLDENVDACDGDSGGPLVCSDEGGETLYGIISWGQHCGYANHPGVYVRVEKYIDWIYEKINLMLQQGKL
ncbi:uncharacterized protein LOC101896627 isoform X2 [Musca domestica]|uniref:limulus clotting factor C n=1 Tax=Musca domestica TaxID=7370 RepID=A0A1I8N3E6_MUSDO|nr:uncharacterized protein LOC101896627 isoform X2 [Musca domestica]